MKRLIIVMSLVLVMVLTSCSNTSESLDISDLSFNEIGELASGSTVTFYGWGGDENINKWLDETVATDLKEKYNITLKRVPMVPGEYIPKLVNEKQVEAEGTIDVVWINGENFYSARQADLLYGPFTDRLPNYEKYLDVDSPDNNYDFGHEINGYEAPYGRAQMVFITDSSLVESIPNSYMDLLEVAKNNPGKITYPDMTDFTGSAFVRNIIYDVVGYDVMLDISADKEAVRQAIQPAMDFLVDIKPYLWREGETYPSTLAQLDNMYSDGEVYMTMNYTPFHIATKIEDGSFSESSVSFVFDKGSIGNTHFLAIPDNAPNKAAAMVLINHILSPNIQASKFDPVTWGDLPVVDATKLSDEEQAMFENINLGEGVLEYDELLSKRVPEMRAELVPIIEEIWREEILDEK